VGLVFSPHPGRRRAMNRTNNRLVCRQVAEADEIAFELEGFISL